MIYAFMINVHSDPSTPDFMSFLDTRLLTRLCTISFLVASLLGEIFKPLHLSQGMLCILLSACSICSRYFPMLVFLGSIIQQTQRFSEEDGIVTDCIVLSSSAVATALSTCWSHSECKSKSVSCPIAYNYQGHLVALSPRG